MLISMEQPPEIPNSAVTPALQIPQQPGTYTMQKIDSNVRKIKFPRQTVVLTSIAHILAAVISIATQSIMCFAIAKYDLIAGYSGFWCGMYFAVAGVIGLMAAATQEKFYNISYTGLSCTAAIFASIMLGFSLHSLANNSVCIHQDRNRFDPSYYCDTTNPVVTACLCLTLVVMSIVELVLSIVSTLVSGRAIYYQCEYGYEHRIQNSRQLYVPRQNPTDGVTNDNLGNPSTPSTVSAEQQGYAAYIQPELPPAYFTAEEPAEDLRY